MHVYVCMYVCMYVCVYIYIHMKLCIYKRQKYLGYPINAQSSEHGQSSRLKGRRRENKKEEASDLGLQRMAYDGWHRVDSVWDLMEFWGDFGGMGLWERTIDWKLLFRV